MFRDNVERIVSIWHVSERFVGLLTEDTSTNFSRVNDLLFSASSDWYESFSRYLLKTFSRYLLQDFSKLRLNTLKSHHHFNHKTIISFNGHFSFRNIDVNVFQAFFIQYSHPLPYLDHNLTLWPFSNPNRISPGRTLDFRCFGIY